MHTWICCLKLGMLAVCVLYTWPSGSNSDTKTSVERGGQLSGPDLLENEFSLWGYLNAIVHDTYTANIPDFKRQFYKHIEAIPNDLLQCVMDSVLSQMQECRGVDGGHLKNVILMCWWLRLILHWVKNVCKLYCFSTLVMSLQNNQLFLTHPLENILHHCVHGW
jgi:hypothetical protein